MAPKLSVCILCSSGINVLYGKEIVCLKTEKKKTVMVSIEVEVLSLFISLHELYLRVILS